MKQVLPATVRSADNSAVEDSLLNRERTGKFANFGPPEQLWCLKIRADVGFFRQIPYCEEQGIFLPPIKEFLGTTGS